MFLASTASTSPAPPTKFLDVCAVAGVVGTFFAASATLLALTDAHASALLMLMLSSVCAASGAICLVGGTQSWQATVFTGVCVTTMPVSVLHFVTRKVKIGDT